MEQVLKEALAAYGMDGAQATLLRHNENATYHIAHGGSEHVLRIHAPRAGFALEMFSVDRHGRGKLEGELSLLRALAEDGFFVQRPVENRMGESVTVLESGDCATMLTWLGGDAVREVTDDIARDAGRLAARMRRSLVGRGDLVGIDRYFYDESLVDRLRALLGKGDMEGAFGDGMEDMALALDAIEAHMAKLRKMEGSFGLIHADLSKGNLIQTKNGLAPIDFCLSGYGFYAQDAGGLVADFGENRREAILKGYADVAGSAPDQRSVDSFVALGVLLCIGSHWRGAMREDWFLGALERWRRTLFRPLSA